MSPPSSDSQAAAQLRSAYEKLCAELAKRIVTTSPDVTVSTNLGPWVNRRGLFARESMTDTFKSERIPSTFNWEFSPKGQHLELGIAEMNLFIALSALGLSHSINGERLLPIGTLYDPFIARGLDALNYACYQDARFLLVATPSGLALAPEVLRCPLKRLPGDNKERGELHYGAAVDVWAAGVLAYELIVGR